MWRPLVTSLSRFIHPIPVMLYRTWANGLMNMTFLTTAIFYKHRPFIHLHYILGIFSLTNALLLGLKGTCNKIKCLTYHLQFHKSCDTPDWSNTAVTRRCSCYQPYENSWTCNMLSQEPCTCTTSPPQPQEECMNKKWPEDYKHAGSWREIWEWPPHWVSPVLQHL